MRLSIKIEITNTFVGKFIVNVLIVVNTLDFLSTIYLKDNQTAILNANKRQKHSGLLPEM